MASFIVGSKSDAFFSPVGNLKEHVYVIHCRTKEGVVERVRVAVNTVVCRVLRRLETALCDALRLP